MFCVPVLRALNKIHSSNCELKLTRLHTLPVAGLLGVKVVGVTSATSVNKLVTAPCVLVVEEPLEVGQAVALLLVHVADICTESEIPLTYMISNHM